MSTPGRRRKDREPLNHVVATVATLPAATDEVPKWIETLAVEPSREDIARRAYHLYEERGARHGHDQDDWLQAERELRHALHELAERMVYGDSYVVV
jgi:hypothetical protein